jgi:hypothetical protein
MVALKALSVSTELVKRFATVIPVVKTETAAGRGFV